MATSDGSLRKNNKLALAKVIWDISAAETIKTISTYILNEMSSVRLKRDNQTFAELVVNTMVLLLHEGTNNQRIDVV